MTKLLLILIVGLLLEAVGVVFLSQGLKEIGAVRTVTMAEITRVVKRGATNPRILVGVLLEALFFACLLLLMARADVSFIWPLTALGYVLTTLAAKWILREEVSPLRWSGVVLIVLGAALVSWSEMTKTPPPAATASAGQPTPRP
jgi:drug/metabolite transporter (DMT)-like permease